MRQRLTAQGKTLGYRMWLFPWLTWGVILFISGVLVLMLFRPDHRLEVVSTMVLAVLGGVFRPAGHAAPGTRRCR
jgi:GABA permease